MDLLSEIVSLSELGSNNQLPEIDLDSEDFFTTQNQEFSDVFGGDMTNQYNQENPEIFSVPEDFNAQEFLDVFDGEMANVAGNNEEIFNDLLSETGFSEVIPYHGK